MDVVERLASFFRDVEPLWTAEKPVSFDPVQTTFLQKLVRENTLQGGITIRKEDFFKGIVYADYFMEVIAQRTTLLEDVRVLVEELEKIDPYLDVDLVLLVRYSGLYMIKDLKGEKLLDAASKGRIGSRHQKGNGAVTGAPEPPDLFDRAVARMYLGRVDSAEVRAALERARGRNDLRLALVADAILGALPSGAIGAPAREALASGDLSAALFELLAALLAASKGWSLKTHVDQLARVSG